MVDPSTTQRPTRRLGKSRKIKRSAFNGKLGTRNHLNPDLDVSKNSGFSLQIILCLIGFPFFYKPSILGYYYSWKHPDFVSRLSWFCFASRKTKHLPETSNKKTYTTRTWDGTPKQHWRMEAFHNLCWFFRKIKRKLQAKASTRSKRSNSNALQLCHAIATLLPQDLQCRIQCWRLVEVRISFMNYLGDPGSFFGAPPK